MPPSPTPQPSPSLFYPQPRHPLTSLLTSPLQTLLTLLYTTQPPITSPPTASPPIRIACISDTHNAFPGLPLHDSWGEVVVDIVLHAGDLSNGGSLQEVRGAVGWLDGVARGRGEGNGYRGEGGGGEGGKGVVAVVVVAGNHDIVLDEACWGAHGARFLNHGDGENSGTGNGNDGDGARLLDWGAVTYLQNRSVAVDVDVEGKGTHRTLKIYGAPHTRRNGNWAFQYPADAGESVWADSVPDDTDILLTHGPAKGRLDFLPTNPGCPALLREVWRVKPRLHVHGHVHGGRGREVLDWGAVQWCYDWVVGGEVRGMRGWGLLCWAVGGWVAAWIMYLGMGRRREGRSEVVNAAWEGNQGAGVEVVEV
ncbi:hypothetical protein E8E13_003067 [Curvularia kusanoi]|uniref:Calcineurin-like phosphoesterase domain-containing protein n=1 Tax=Curvularia kusanoi TaxID=90978 RepID=A0A9P4T6B9_CURKU|nr:hypothetical protein E8E13_003067 [Curvularia kusanoi]